MRIDAFVGGSYQMDALSFGIQRSINLFPINTEVQGTKEPSALRSSPGLVEFTTVGAGTFRGLLKPSRYDRAFCVVGNKFYEVLADGSSVEWGTIDAGDNLVSMDDNGTQICLVDGVKGYIFDLTTNTFTQITSDGFPNGATRVVFQDTYFIVTKPDTSLFYISDNNDGLTWGALDFASAESNPDKLVTLLSDNGNLWLFGDLSVEVYQNTGASAFPFERIAGAVIQTGCAAAFTAAKFDNTVIWLGIDEYGRGVVWIADGYRARRVSTQAIEARIDEVPDFTDSYAWVYHEQGHIFYCLQIKGLDTTLVYDAATGLWHERQYNGSSQHKGNTQMFFNQKNLIGDREGNKLYEISLRLYDDDGVAIQRERIFPHIQDEKRQIVHKRLELDAEVGVGLTLGQGSDPQIMMQYSDDGGRTFSSERWRTLGKIGTYRTRVFWNKVGMARDRVYKIRVSDPVQVQFNGAYLNGT